MHGEDGLVCGHCGRDSVMKLMLWFHYEIEYYILDGDGWVVVARVVGTNLFDMIIQGVEF